MAHRERRFGALTVEAEIESLRRVAEGGQALVDRIDAAPEGSILMIPDTLLFLGAVWNPTYNASLGAVEALLASGGNRVGQCSPLKHISNARPVFPVTFKPV